MKTITSFLIAAAFLLTACSTNPDSMFNKENMGTLGGGAIGAVLGSNVGKGSGNTAAIAVGTLLGAFVGSEIGKSLDQADRMYANQAYQTAHQSPIGETISWNNPESGNQGSYTPVRDGRTTSGRYCREYEQTVIIDGRREVGYGTACQSTDGRWEIMGS